MPDPTVRSLAACALVGLLAACSVPADGVMPADGIFDPYEQSNRKFHTFNRGLDKAFVRPASKG